MAQSKTGRNTVAASSTRMSGGTAVAVRPSKTTRGPAPTHEQISRRAHEIWLKKGRKSGQDEQNWLEAEAQLRAEMSGK
ncbi:MAG: DUF2934 domain-containing protein [Sedimentisphaerales bacterium]|nr:DUF2934 domain-containing protein [Sedimentisphaerales bacterium]